jgi:hypothetical protein
MKQHNSTTPLTGVQRIATIDELPEPIAATANEPRDAARPVAHMEAETLGLQSAYLAWVEVAVGLLIATAMMTVPLILFIGAQR